MIEAYVPIGHLQPNKTYTQIFQVEGGEIRSDRNKNPYVRLTLRDVTGTISGAIWGMNLAHAEAYGRSPSILDPGTYITLTISTQIYRGALQFNAEVDSLALYHGIPENITDYVIGPNQHVLDVYTEELQNLVDDLEDADYRDVVQNAIQRTGLFDKLRVGPYGLSGPLAYRGGLLIHTVHSVRLALASYKESRELDLELNRSLIVLGCIFRNIGWNTTTMFDGDFLRSRDAFYMTGIFGASARYTDHTFLGVESDLNIAIPEGKKQALHNICNEPENIKTLEGRLVALANDTVDLIQFGGSSLRGPQKGSWKDSFFVGHNE